MDIFHCIRLLKALSNLTLNTFNVMLTDTRTSNVSHAKITLTRVELKLLSMFLHRKYYQAAGTEKEERF